MLIRFRYYWIFKSFYILKYKNIFSLLLIIFFNICAAPEITLLEKEVSVENETVSWAEIFINVVIGFTAGILIYSFFEQNFFNDTIIHETFIRGEVNSVMEDLLSSVETNHNLVVSTATAISLAATKISPVVTEVTMQVASNPLPAIILPPQGPMVEELTINSEKFYNFFFNSLDFPKLQKISHLPNLGEQFAAQKELLNDYIRQYRYDPNTVKAFCQEVLLRAYTLFKCDLNLLSKYYLQLAFDFYSKSEQFNLMSFKFNYILDLTVDGVNNGCTFSIPDILKQFCFASFFGLTRFFITFYHPDIGQGHFSAYLIYNLVGFTEQDYGRTLSKGKDKVSLNIRSLPITKKIFIFPERFNYFGF